MAKNYTEQLEQLDTPWFYRLAWGGGVLIFLIAGYIWWNYASIHPQRVFWGTVSSNLITTGVTKQTVTDEQSGSSDQIQKINLGAENVVFTTSTVEQKATDAASTRVVTETIGTPTTDYARYTSIQTDQKTESDQPFNFTEAINIWSQQEVTEMGSGSFGEALFGLMPIAFIQGSERNAIVNEMKQRGTYRVDYNAVKKRNENGRLLYEYTVQISPEQYVAALKRIDRAMGLQQLEDVDPSQYQGAQALQITVVIDARAQQLVSLAYPENTRVETYSAYGVFQPPVIPQQTIPRAELQQRLNNILSTQ